MDSDAIYPIYLASKFVAYAAWCFFGLHLLRGQASLGRGAGYGLVRFLLGAFFGVGIFLIGGMLHLEVPRHPLLMYLGIYVPVRYVEWSILALLLISGAGARFADKKTQLWTLGGIGVSHLADLPLILLTYEGAKDFLPVGRFLC